MTGFSLLVGSFFCYLCPPNLGNKQFWFLGRVARQRSAKPRTAVRIRQEPQKSPFVFFLQEGFLFIQKRQETP